jgi:hypothetical protein
MTGPRPAGRPWTPAEEAKLRELIISRVKVDLIAKKLKRSPGAAPIRRYLATASPVTAVRRQWSGAWIGAWGGSLKHIVLVEAVAEDGAALVVYAVGDNPSFGVQRTWRLPEGIASSGRYQFRGRNIRRAQINAKEVRLALEADQPKNDKFGPVKGGLSKSEGGVISSLHH